MGQFSPTMNTVSLVLSGLVCLCQGSPIQIQTFLVETNTSVLCRQGVCISEDPHKQKCPEDFFEDECPEYAEYCGALSHRGQWMSLFCKRTCHCQNSQGVDHCCPSLIEDRSGDGIIDNEAKVGDKSSVSPNTTNEGISNVHETNVGENDETEDSDDSKNHDGKEQTPTTVSSSPSNTEAKDQNIGTGSGNENSEENISADEYVAP